MNSKSISIIILVTLMLAGCASTLPTSAPVASPSDLPTLDFPQATQVPPGLSSLNQTTNAVNTPAAPHSNQQTVIDLAFDTVMALKNQDMVKLTQLVDPKSGLRFSPYAYVKDTDQFFTADQVINLMNDTTVYLWGNYDGSGEPIELTFAEYYPKFVYDVDFASAPQLSLNHRLGSGNSIDNAQDYYPGAMIVEFYFPGFDPQYNGMDWRSLKLVFMQSGQAWYLVDIIHDQWTI